MHIDELHARHGRRGKYSSRHRVGNVVEFQIEKNARSQLRHLADRFGSSGCEQLAANFEHADKIRHLPGEVQRCGQRVKIEGHNQAAAWMGVKGQGSGRARNILLLAFVGSVALGRQLHEFQPHLAHSRVDQADLSGYPIGYINFASLLVGTPVIDTYHFKLAVSRVDDAHPGVEGQVGVCRSQSLSAKGLPVGGPLAIEFRTIPTGIADPDLHGFDWFTQVGDERSFHDRCDEEHQRHPPDSSPSDEEWSLHSVFFSLQTFKKCSRKTALCQPKSVPNLSLISLIVLHLIVRTSAPKFLIIASLALGSAKLAVPTCTADAPTHI